MRYIIMLFGAATTIAGVIIVISPETVFGLIRKHMASMGMHILAVVIRIVLGAALILCSDNYDTLSALMVFQGQILITVRSKE